jgi:hypothetical protein
MFLYINIAQSLIMIWISEKTQEMVIMGPLSNRFLRSHGMVIISVTSNESHDGQTGENVEVNRIHDRNNS